MGSSGQLFLGREGGRAWPGFDSNFPFIHGPVGVSSLTPPGSGCSGRPAEGWVEMAGSSCLTVRWGVMGAWESRVLMFWVRRKACRDGGWALSLAHVLRQGPRAGGEGRGVPQRPHSCMALGKKQAQDVSSGPFLFSNLNSSSRDPSLRPSLQSP